MASGGQAGAPKAAIRIGDYKLMSWCYEVAGVGMTNALLSCLVLSCSSSARPLVLSCLVLPCLVAKFVLSCLAACLVLSCLVAGVGMTNALVHSLSLRCVMQPVGISPARWRALTLSCATQNS
jgi:hypothetical protein